MPSDTNTHTNDNAVVDAPIALFEPGEFHATDGVLSFLSQRLQTVVGLYDRHIVGDWPEMTPVDQALNYAAVKDGGVIRSRYMIDNQPIWVITEADRSITTILLPSEY